jgi:biotin carboxylase
MARVLLLLPTNTYRAADLLAAAKKLGVEVVVAAERPNVMAQRHPDTLLTLDFRNTEAAVHRALEYHSRYPLNAVIPVDEETALLSASIGAALALKHNSVEAARAARDKSLLCRILSQGGVQVPCSEAFPLTAEPAQLALRIQYPCVLKPLFLSGSQGVIRADDQHSFTSAWRRIARILARPEINARGGRAAGQILVQEYIAGTEYALEGLLSNGSLRVLALFDKPDPLNGPYFEETLYVTPSRLPPTEQQSIEDTVSRGARAMGLAEGPIHAEVRLNSRGPWILEIAARSIGGLCSRSLRFGTGLSLDEVVLRHSLGLPIEDTHRTRPASGVMMIPIPRAGLLREIHGLDEARAVPGVEEVTITARVDNPLTPLPEGSSYLGFILATAGSADEVEAALRCAYAGMRFTIDSSPTECTP